MTKEDWEAVIGLEVHAQVSSNTKLFSSSSTEFGAEHNTQVSLVDAAMPGTLPILNYYCIEQAIRTGLALSAEINKCSYFDRKNYFYPDLPQGYQITQFFEPIVKNGRVFINDNEKEIRIARIHLEQDAGKSVHEESKTYVDLNRAGVALMEIVSEPDLRSSAEAAECMKKLRQILRYTGSCDGDMEKGSLRCDANVSVRLKGSSTFGTRCEIKNLNSIRYIVQAIDYEIQRQIEILESGEEISQDTLLFDVALGKTKVMRSKEDASDYRYFPEPDLLPVEVSQEKIDLIQSSLPELPDQKKLRYIEELGINEYDANVITSDKAIADYFEELIKKHDSKLAVTWLTVELFGRLNKANIDIVSSPIKANALSELLDFIVDGTISAKLGKQVFDSMFETGKPASLIIEEQDLKQITDRGQIAEVIDTIINNNQDKVQEYKSGKTRLYGFFVGEVMKLTKGKASPDVVNSILSEKLDKVPEGYPAGGAKNFIHGIDYQKLWLMLFFRRAVNRKYFFCLATEMSSATGFDDIVFLDEQNGTTVCMLIQVKHKQDDSKKICVGDLLTKSGELNLVKHFAAFLEIRGNEEFKDKIKDFFIVINVDFDYESLASKGITVEKIETQDEFLNIGDSAKYKLRDLHNNIAQYLEQGMSAGGREVSDEEIRGFLNELVFVVNLPNDVELEKLIRNEINDDLARRFKYFGNNGYVFNALFTMMSDWMKDKRGRFLSPEEGEKFFREVEKLPSTLSEIKKSQDEIKCVVKRTEEKVDEIVRRKRTSTNGRRAREPIWFNMMEPVASFTGRSSELKALHDALQKSTGKQAVISQVASISGLGGVGKSELARKYAYKYGKDYYVNAIWIDAESTETMKNSFLDLANNRLGIPTKDRHERDKTIENIVREVYAFFARRGRRSLFIFDNAEGYEDIKRFLPSSLHPRHKKPYILITSRDCKWNVRGEGDIKVIQLDEFGEVEALEFVRKALNIENNLQDREIEELTRELQYFPLALGQAVVYIQDRNEESRLRGDKRFKISDYLKEYQQNAGELLKKGVYENEDRYTKTVLTTWNITMTYICKHRTDKICRIRKKHTNLSF